MREFVRSVFALQVGGEMLRVWDTDLRRAWRRHDIELVRFLLGLAPLVPGRSELASRLKWRSRIPRSLLVTWDACRKAIGVR